MLESRSNLKATQNIRAPIQGEELGSALADGFVRIVPLKNAGRWVPDDDVFGQLIMKPENQDQIALVRGANWHILRTSFNQIDQNLGLSSVLAELEWSKSGSYLQLPGSG